MSKISFTRVSALLGLSAVILDTLIMIGMGALTPDYNPIRQYISELGSSINPCADILNLWWSVYSLPMLLFVFGLYQMTKRNRYGWIGPLLLGLDVIGNGILSGIFTCDVGCHGTSFSNTMHYVSSAVGTIAATFAPLGVYVGIHKDPKWKSFRTRLITIATLLIASFLVISGVEISVFLSHPSAVSGLVQRIHTAIYYWFLIELSVQMLRRFRGKH